MACCKADAAVDGGGWLKPEVLPLVIAVEGTAVVIGGSAD